MTAPQEVPEDIARGITSLATQHGLVTESIRLRSRGAQPRLLDVVVDLPEDAIGSVDLDTVAALSRAVSDMLDADDSSLGSAPYEVEIGTPGAERELSEPRHFRRARTRLARFDLADGTRIFARVIDAPDEETVLVMPEAEPGAKPRAGAGRRSREQRTLRRDEITHARVVVELNPPRKDDAAHD